jgi:hypothetical protein
MYRIDNPTAATVFPPPAAAGPRPNGFFTVGSAAGAVPATIVDMDWLNCIQEEICTVVAAGLITLSKSSQRNLLDAINYLIAHSLGFTPVQQGGGASQLNNKVYLGWDGTSLRAQVDATDQGRLGLLGKGQTWTGANSFTQNVNVPSLTGTGTLSAPTISGTTLSASGGVSGASVTAAGAVSGNTVTAAGAVTGGSVTGTTVQSIGGNITANGARLRAAYGARGSGDANAAVILNDYFFTAAGSGYYLTLPNNVILQFFHTQAYAAVGTMYETVQNLPVAFPSGAHYFSSASWWGPSPPQVWSPVSARPYNSSQVGLTINGQSGVTIPGWLECNVISMGV